MEQHDPDFLIAVCRRRPEALAQLIAQLQAPVYTFLARMVGPEAAEPLFHKIWKDVFDHAASFPGNKTALRWIFRSVHQRSKPYFRAAIKPETGGLSAAIEGLAPEPREVYLLREYAGMPFREIAEALDTPLDEILRRMNAAIDRLRPELEGFRAA